MRVMLSAAVVYPFGRNYCFAHDAAGAQVLAEAAAAPVSSAAVLTAPVALAFTR